MQAISVTKLLLHNDKKDFLRTFKSIFACHNQLKCFFISLCKKRNFPTQKSKHYYTHAPYIAFIIVSITFYYFRCYIINCSKSVRIKFPRIQKYCCSKIYYFDFKIFRLWVVNQDIFWLQISMNDVSFMAVCNC